MRWLIFSFLMALNVPLLFSQDASNEAEVDSVLNEILSEDTDLYELFDGNTNYHFLYFGSNYTSGTFFNGMEIGNNNYNFSGQFYYFITNGLYFGTSGAWYSQSDPHFNTSIITAGFTKALPKWDFLRYRIAYDRYVYLNEDPGATHDYNSDINMGITLRKNSVGARFDYTFLMGEKYDHQFSFDLFSKIKLLSLNKYDRIQFEPELSNSFVNEDVVYYSEIGTGPWSTPVYTEATEFGLVNTEISLPISLSYNDFDLEIAYKYNLPHLFDDFRKDDCSGYFRVSLGYIISIN